MPAVRIADINHNGKIMNSVSGSVLAIDCFHAIVDITTIKASIYIMHAISNIVKIFFI
jgi:hypothetical protein